MRILRGAAASPGVAQGPWVRIMTAKLPEGGTVGPDAIDAERARLAEALESQRRAGGACQ